MNETTGTYTTGDGLALHTRTWSSEDDPQRGLLIVHGLGEHSGRSENKAQHPVRLNPTWILVIPGFRL